MFRDLQKKADMNVNIQLDAFSAFDFGLATNDAQSPFLSANTVKQRWRTVSRAFDVLEWLTFCATLNELLVRALSTDDHANQSSLL